MIYQAEKTLGERGQDQPRRTRRRNLETAIERRQEGPRERTTTRKLDAAQQRLEQSLHKIAETLYKAQAQGGGPGCGPRRGRRASAAGRRRRGRRRVHGGEGQGRGRPREYEPQQRKRDPFAELVRRSSGTGCTATAGSRTSDVFETEDHPWWSGSSSPASGRRTCGSTSTASESCVSGMRAPHESVTGRATPPDGDRVRALRAARAHRRSPFDRDEGHAHLEGRLPHRDAGQARRPQRARARRTRLKSGQDDE